MIIDKKDCKLVKAGAHGYGVVRHNGKVVMTHHLAYAQDHGVEVGDISGAVIRHRCGVLNCVNPLHLQIGTQDDKTKLGRIWGF